MNKKRVSAEESLNAFSWTSRLSVHSSSFIQLSTGALLQPVCSLATPEQGSYYNPNCFRCSRFHLQQKAFPMNLCLLFKFYPSFKVQNKSYHL